MKGSSKKCHMLKVLRNNKFTRTRKADADRRRYDTCPSGSEQQGFYDCWLCLCYWILIHCVLLWHRQWHLGRSQCQTEHSQEWSFSLRPKKMIYVFSGCNGDYKRLNSIEVISETSLVKNNIYMANHRGAYENLDLTWAHSSPNKRHRYCYFGRSLRLR